MAREPDSVAAVRWGLLTSQSAVPWPGLRRWKQPCADPQSEIIFALSLNGGLLLHWRVDLSPKWRHVPLICPCGRRLRPWQSSGPMSPIQHAARAYAAVPRSAPRRTRAHAAARAPAARAANSTQRAATRAGAMRKAARRARAMRRGAQRACAAARCAPQRGTRSMKWRVQLQRSPATVAAW